MQTAPTPHHSLSLLARVALIVVALLAATAAVAAVVPAAPYALGLLLVLLVGFAICALPFATVLGIVLAITRSRRGAMDAYPTYPAPGGPARAAAPMPIPRRAPDPGADLPPGLTAQVARIRDKLAALRDPRQWPLLSPEDQIQVERIASEHLPALLATYRGIPRGTQDWPVAEGGPSAVEVTERQLRLLQRSLDAVAEHVFQAGATQLLAQQRFLQDQLGDGEPGELTLPPR